MFTLLIHASSLTHKRLADYIVRSTVFHVWVNSSTQRVDVTYECEIPLHANGGEILCAVARYDWFGDHNPPWQTDLNNLNNTIDWNKLNAITATPNPFDNRDPAQTGGGFGLLPWYLRSAVITQRPAPGPAPGPAPTAQVVGG